MCVFNVADLRPISWKLSARLSVLLPLQGLVLLGLAPVRPTQRRLRDPIEWLLSHAPHAWGNLSYAQYVLQFVAYALWPVKARKKKTARTRE